MSAYVVSKSHIEAIVRVGLAGPGGRAVSPDTAWHRLSWYTSERFCDVLRGALISALPGYSEATTWDVEAVPA